MIFGTCDDAEYIEIVNNLVKAMCALEAAENEIAELKVFKDLYYKTEHDSKYLEILLDIISKSPDKENIMDRYNIKKQKVLNDDIPF